MNTINLVFNLVNNLKYYLEIDCVTQTSMKTAVTPSFLMLKTSNKNDPIHFLKSAQYYNQHISV